MQPLQALRAPTESAGVRNDKRSAASVEERRRQGLLGLKTPPAKTMREATLQIALAALGISVIGLLIELKKRDKKSKKKPDNDPPIPKRQASIRRYEALILERGSVGSKDYRVHVLQKDTSQRARELSLWHDVPLVAPSAPSSPRNAPPLFNFVCEIPKCTRKKFEVATDETK